MRIPPLFILNQSDRSLQLAFDLDLLVSHGPDSCKTGAAKGLSSNAGIVTYKYYKLLCALNWHLKGLVGF